ncbi:hypothetical protein FJV41_46550 [Myxococcus llanfairpwllgwyngyllgogerychwyrndrobwllllantysiliogogogochensis]|uniref:Uncharacterized protein n=1 Tax=Myxococcus llanfairpwllgwyngyllgogerychwyrndrobwllllantysiliogogogochensis TaxID=2590453 RepID=A0A540WJ82_9BACT|nr:hypothetical protein [Myxococcus llanfairpwllgwyngyllgogerychwyrndrobwllllantysiliogogogochensis]TQF09079.1 hypothetical protein FJV41_46550 [Myxococcus llanfairpwllgwyngyllgogerychwyrndrobwllllantysiliogogogochensis]
MNIKTVAFVGQASAVVGGALVIVAGPIALLGARPIALACALGAFVPMAIAVACLFWLDELRAREQQAQRHERDRAAASGPPRHALDAAAALNAALSADPEAVAQLLATRVPCGNALALHPSIQVARDTDGRCTVGVLGLINGVLGTIPAGPRAGWGWVTCLIDDDSKPICFEVTDTGGDGVSPVRPFPAETRGGGR